MNAVRRGPEIPGVSLSASAGITNFYENPQRGTPVGGSSFIAPRGPQIGRDTNFLPILVEKEDTDTPSIKNVWFDNFELELPIISELLEKYPYVAMVSYLVFLLRHFLIIFANRTLNSRVLCTKNTAIQFVHRIFIRKSISG